MATQEWRDKNKDKVLASSRKWFAANKEKQRDYVKARGKVIQDWFREYKKNLSCIRCGENHPSCLDFHHIDPSQKEVEVPVLVSRGRSIENILKEIAKCEILCANCHRKEHSK